MMSEVPIVPKGRGALLKRLLLRQSDNAAAANPGPAPVFESIDQPKPRGRAAILEKFKHKQLMAANLGCSVEPISSKFLSEKEDEISVASSFSRMSIETPIPTAPVTYLGTTGTHLKTTCNYIKLNTASNAGLGVFEYELRFEPPVDSRDMKIKLLNAIVPEIGRVRSFDGGHTLYLPFKTSENQTTYSAQHPVDNTNIKLILIYKKQKPYSDCIHLFNVLFKRIMKTLCLTRIGRNFFDQKRSILIPQHKLEVLPGYVTVVEEYEGGLFLCLDTQHKVLRTQTVLEILRELHCICKGDPRRYKDMVLETLMGQSILTQYNNKLYRIDDILWDKNPLCSFETVSGPVTFVDYFKKQYNVDIKDMQQPLLLNNVTQRVPGQITKVDRQLCLVPELCIMTGLTDKMRENFVLMKDIAVYTRVTPSQRLNALRKYIANVNNCPEAKQILADWGLTLSNGTIDLKARVVDREVILFGDGVTGDSGTNAEWTQLSARNKVLYAVDLHCWAVLCTPNSQRQAQEYIEISNRIASSMGIRMQPPQIHLIPNDSTNSWIDKTREVIRKNQDMLQIIVFICPTARNDRYSAIKKLCCSIAPVPSQVINVRTLNNQSKLRGIVQKIALQINCKLGGSLWSVRFPFKNWMICGIDVFHCDRKRSVCAFVSSLNDSMSRWYTSTVFQKSEIGDYFKVIFVSALEKKREINGQYPTNVVIFRDGVGDGQIKQCINYEISQYQQALKDMKLEGQVKLCVILVQKRINTRILKIAGQDEVSNPPPGTILDHTVTRRNFEDFFLVSQNVRQGTVSPTHYVVLHDTVCLPPDRMQRLTYKMCHLYYNWSGTIGVPAPCQYAHKVAYLTGKHINKLPDQKLADRLFYL